MTRDTRWRRVSAGEIDDVVQQLEEWPCSTGGMVRHLYPLATIESRGHSVVRVAENDQGWAGCIVLPNQLLVPCGDAGVVEAAGVPQRRWQVVVGDAEAADALLGRWGRDNRLIVHVQRYQAVDPERVPDEDELPDPGLRPAEPPDVDGLADLAVQLHIDDHYGPPPGRAGRRAYRQRMFAAVERGSVYCVGDVGEPLVKIERSVDSKRYGVQLSGICVRPDSRRQGLGLSAVAAAVRECLREGSDRPISLHVRDDNEPALKAYAKAGFVDQEEWRQALRT